MKKLKLIFTIACVSVYFASSFKLVGQKVQETAVDYDIYAIVDSTATYEGGKDALTQFVKDSFNMPKSARDMGVSGLVLVQFIVEKNGNVSDVRAIAPEARKLGYGLEYECIRVLKLTSGQWTAARRNGKPVRSYWRFTFDVDNSNSDLREKIMSKAEKEIIEDDSIYKDVDSSAQNITVKDGLENSKAIKFNMPRTAMELGISGKIVIQFVIEKNGTVSNVIPVSPKEKQLGYGLEEECMRVVKLTGGQWKPAIKGGIPVRSYMRFPFDIDNSGGY